jgi:hypothetical protein
MSGLLVDLRDDPTPPERLYFGKKRKPEQITGVMLHSTACRLGEKPERWKRVNAHIGITMQGRVILMHDFLSVIWHGNKPSPELIGIEIDGNHLGLSTGQYWKGAALDPLYAAQVASANEILLPFLQKWFTENGVEWKYTLAHRQSSGDREYDPGVEIWQLVALPWMRETGSTDGDLVWGTGAKIPNDWDSRK